MPEIQQHPDYHKGFYDAQNSTPVHIKECTNEYVAGWYAYWNVRERLNDSAAHAVPSVHRTGEGK